ncbi:methylosome protein WDR77-like [Bacillus rossius redtenbacheri]|uniref:methylosome protein WDR77-like n=1 Tax=Bacillus rossius redtenbacheri TaxID=93214 RepID=UPI002FDD70D0
MYEDLYEVEPNRNAEAYRNYVPQYFPAQVEKYIEFIEFSEDGYMLLGSSNMTGRYWVGSVWYFTDPEAAPDVDKCLTGSTTETGVCDGQFLPDKQKVLVAEDSGTLQLLGLSEVPDEQSIYFSTIESKCEHDDTVLSLSVFPGEMRAVSGSADMNIKVWNVENLKCVQTYRPAHTHQVTCVSTCPERSNVFASCSLDGTLCTWDTRSDSTSKPATVVLRENCSFGCVAWQPSTSDILAVGSNCGTVRLMDIRCTKEPLWQFTHFERPMYRIRFADHRPNWMAICADESKLEVVDCSTLEVVYTDDRHEDFVRGLAWNPKTEHLHSCGWDKQVLVHSPVVNMDVNGSTPDCKKDISSTDVIESERATV